MECFKLVFDHLAWIEHQFVSGIRDSRKAESLWGMMSGVGGIRKLGLLCWGFKGVQEEIPSEEASTLQIGSVAFPPGQCTSPRLHPCHRLFDQDGVVDWCIVLLEMPLTRFELCWPLPTESLPELPSNLNIVTLTLTLWLINSQKAVWSIPYVCVAFFPSLKQNFIAYCSSKVSSRLDCIFEIQLWQSGFSRVYSNYCCSCSFEAEIIKISQSSHKMYSNNILNFQF